MRTVHRHRSSHGSIVHLMLGQRLRARGHRFGDLAAGLDRLIDNVLDRTYAVKIAKAGSVQFVK